MPAILRDGAFVALGMRREPNLTDGAITALPAFSENRAWQHYQRRD